MNAAAANGFPSRAAIVVVPLWLMMAASSVVNVEPAPFDLMAIALCGFFLVLGLRIPTGLLAPMLILAIFLVANVVSIIFAPAKLAEKLPNMVFYFGLTVYLVIVWVFLTSLIVTDPKRIQRVLWNGWLAAAVFAATLAIAAYFRLIPGADAYLMAGRAKAAFKDANVYGPFLIPVILYLLIRIQGGTIMAKSVYLVLFLYLSIGLLIGFSRGAWGNFVASLLALAGLTFLNARTLKDYASLLWAGSAIVAVTVLLVVAAISTPRVGEMFAVRASLLQKYDTEAGGRFSTQLAALDVIAQHPLGLGPNRTKPYLRRNPHNVYLKILAENGWVGGAAFFAFLGVTLWKGFWFALRPGPLQREFTVVYACTLGIVAESVIIDTLHWRHYFVLLAMLWGTMLAPSITTNPPRRPA